MPNEFGALSLDAEYLRLVANSTKAKPKRAKAKPAPKAEPAVIPIAEARDIVRDLIDDLHARPDAEEHSMATAIKFLACVDMWLERQATGK